MITEYLFPSIVDQKQSGLLRVFESNDIPFPVKRVFSVCNSEPDVSRGKHAHKICNQLICCVAGRVKLNCDNGTAKQEVVLSPTSKGVLVSAGIWAEQQFLDNGSVIIVFCDQPYDEADYLRDYEQFLAFIQGI